MGTRTISDVALQVRQALDPRGEGDAMARRLAFSFAEDFDHAHPAKRYEIVSLRPPPTGDERYDAMLAALVEHLCARWKAPTPRWVDDKDRFLTEWWFVSGLRRLHAMAIVQSPISFKRRGVFILDNALSYV